jgi:hypothetical protein
MFGIIKEFLTSETPVNRDEFETFVNRINLIRARYASITFF